MSILASPLSFSRNPFAARRSMYFSRVPASPRSMSGLSMPPPLLGITYRCTSSQVASRACLAEALAAGVARK